MKEKPVGRDAVEVMASRRAEELLSVVLLQRPSKGTCPGTLEEPLPAFPDRNLSHPEELAPRSKREPLHPQAEVTQPIAGRSGQGPRTQGTGFQPRLREEKSPA